MEKINIAVVCTVLGIVISYRTFQRNVKADAKNDARENTAVAVKLDYISKGVDDIRLDIKSTNREVEELKEKFARHDESLKSVHKRVDKIEKECAM